jgi:predicted O-methyltransferase YrrM
VILTALELDVFTAIEAGCTAEEVAARSKTNPRATEMLLNALTSMGLLKKEQGIFTNTPATARFFVAGSKDDSRAALMHTVHLWVTWSGLTESVRTGGPSHREEIPDRGEEWTEAFIAAMHRNASERATAVVQAAAGNSVKRMLDIGGGSGAYSIAFAQANPQLQSDILDLSTVTPLTQRYIDAAGVTDRVRTRVGDLRTDKLGEGYDLALVSAICHMLSPEQNQDLVKRAFDALAPGGRIVIQDFILAPDKAGPKFAALFSLNMLVGTESGASYSEPEYRAWLEDAGFDDVHVVPLPGLTGLIIGTRPA